MIPTHCVTSWSADGEALYGEKFRSGFHEHWTKPHGIPLEVYSDNDLLLLDADITPFRDRERDDQTASGTYDRGALKWSWKCFALAASMHAATGRLGAGWMVWIDGDVEFIDTPPEWFFDVVCPAGADLSFLKRDWTYASETGFVCYNLASVKVRAMIQAMRGGYLHGDFRQLDNWGDAAMFDHWRRKWHDNLIENDLAKDAPVGDLHVWPHTVLGGYMEHRKGPKRKRSAYGGAV